MERWEKVNRGITAHKNNKSCENCPYDGAGCLKKLIEDGEAEALQLKEKVVALKVDLPPERSRRNNRPRNERTRENGWPPVPVATPRMRDTRPDSVEPTVRVQTPRPRNMVEDFIIRHPPTPIIEPLASRDSLDALSSAEEAVQRSEDLRRAVNRAARGEHVTFGGYMPFPPPSEMEGRRNGERVLRRQIARGRTATDYVGDILVARREFERGNSDGVAKKLYVSNALLDRLFTTRDVQVSPLERPRLFGMEVYIDNSLDDAQTNTFGILIRGT